MMKKAYIYLCIAIAFFVGCADDTESPMNGQDATVLTRADIKEDIVKDERDGEAYRTVKIGDQWWMAENLRYAADSSFCYNDEEYFCEAYGRLYPWIVAMNLDTVYRRNGAIYADVVDSLHQGVCPDAWHVPTKVEWKTMIEFVKEHNGTEGDGTSLRSPEMWVEYSDGSSKVTHSDRFGFSVLPAGMHTDPTAGYRGNIYTGFTGDAYFWTATEVNSYRNDVTRAYYVRLYSQSNDNAVRTDDDESKRNAMSIRCVKN